MKRMIEFGLAILIAVVLSIGVADAKGKNKGNKQTWGKPFQTILKKIDALEGRVVRLEHENARLKHELAKLKPVLGLAPYLSLNEHNTINGLAPPHLFFTGLNVHIRSGGGQTEVLDGRGNLVVGYNEDNVGNRNSRTGSHNLIVGPEHTYSSFGGLIAGFGNSVVGAHASVTGGTENKASGDESSVSGGRENTASGVQSSVTGGFRNFAIGVRSSVNGGRENLASGNSATVSGGANNSAAGNDSHAP